MSAMQCLSVVAQCNVVNEMDIVFNMSCTREMRRSEQNQHLQGVAVVHERVLEEEWPLQRPGSLGDVNGERQGNVVCPVEMNVCPFLN